MQPRVLDLLYGAAIKRINGAEFEAEKLRPTPTVRRMHGRYRRMAASMKRIEAALHRRGFAIGYKGTLGTDHRAEVKRRAAFDAKKADRTRRARDLRDQALIDLVDATPAQAKRYLVTLKNKLEAV